MELVKIKTNKLYAAKISLEHVMVALDKESEKYESDGTQFLPSFDVAKIQKTKYRLAIIHNVFSNALQPYEDARKKAQEAISNEYKEESEKIKQQSADRSKEVKNEEDNKDVKEDTKNSEKELVDKYNAMIRNKLVDLSNEIGEIELEVNVTKINLGEVQLPVSAPISFFMAMQDFVVE